MFSGFRPLRAILALLLLVGVTVSFAGAQNAPLGIVVQPSDLAVTIATDKNAYQIGENVRINGTVNQNAFLYIVDVDPANSVTLIFPNAFSTNNQIPAGPYALPDKPGYDLRVTPPAGTEFEYAIASTEPLNLQAVFSQANPFASLGNPQQAQGRIQGAIQGLVPTAKSAVSFTSFQVGGQQPPIMGTAFLLIESNPSGAQVFLNGQARGATPASFLLAAGAYQILLRAPNCQDFFANIVLAPGEQRRLSATLVCAQQPPINPQDPTAQIAAQAQTITPSDPRFAALAVQFYASLGQNQQGIAARLQAALGTAPQGIVPQPTQGAQFSIFPEMQNINLNQAVLQQGQTLLLGTITLPTNTTVGGLPLSAGTYGVGVMASTAGGFTLHRASAGAQFGGFVIVLINFNTGSVVAFFFFPTVSFFPIFFPVFSPIFVFQIIIQITIVVPGFPFPFPFPFPTVGCPALPFVTPINVPIGGPNDTLVATTAFIVQEVGLSLSGVLIRIQSLGPGLSFQLVTGSLLRFGSIFPASSGLIALPVGSSFVLRVDGGGKTGCVNATTNFFTITGTASNN
ncbi:DUF4384 domain-containing protein [Candidatus Acetothermia bacterium]|nr:DUF4384 domain-containing protein [Candidatus Acetothermia bacterium]